MALVPKKVMAAKPAVKPLYTQRTTLAQGFNTLKKSVKGAAPFSLPKKKT